MVSKEPQALLLVQVTMVVLRVMGSLFFVRASQCHVIGRAAGLFLLLVSAILLEGSRGRLLVHSSATFLGGPRSLLLVHVVTTLN